MQALLWSLCFVFLLVNGSHALIQPAAAGGIPAITDTIIPETADPGPGNVAAQLPKFSRAAVHVYVASPPRIPQQEQPQDVPLERLKVGNPATALQKHETGAAMAITRHTGEAASVLETGRPSWSSLDTKTPEGWPDVVITNPKVPSVDITRQEGWPKLDIPDLHFRRQAAPTRLQTDTANKHDDSTSADSSPEPVKTDTTPSAPAEFDAVSACSTTDSSAAAVLRCVNAVRTNPKAFTDGYECSYESWIDEASSPPRPALVVDSRLRDSAQGHADWMASAKTVSHTGDGGSTVAQRIKDAGYTTFPQAENIAGGQLSAYEVTMDWMCSEGHRNTIINCDYDNVGTGVAQDSTGRMYYAQNFGASANCGNQGCKC